MFDTLWRKFRKQNLYNLPTVLTEWEQISLKEQELQDDQFRKVVTIFPRYVCHTTRGERIREVGNQTKQEFPPGRVSAMKDATTYEVQRVGFQVSVGLKHNLVYC